LSAWLKRNKNKYYHYTAMTIEQARKKLGKRAERMSDDDITKLIHFLERLVNKVIDDVVSPDL
jgi:hypothetical protein